MRSTIYIGTLYDMEMEVYSDNYFYSISLDVNGEHSFSGDLYNLVGHLKKMFNHIWGFDKDVKTNINLFVDNFRDEYIKRKTIHKFFRKYSYYITSFANKFNMVGTLDFNSFNIGKYNVEFDKYRIVNKVIDKTEMVKIRMQALAIRNEQSHSFWEDLYLVLETKLDKLFEELGTYNSIKNKFITITIQKELKKPDSL